MISYAPTRDEAARALAGALARSRIHGVVTNRDLLVRVLRHPAFLAGDTDTRFFDRHGLDALAEPLAGKDAYRLSALAAALADAARNRAAAHGARRRAERVAQPAQCAATQVVRRRRRRAGRRLPAHS